MKPATIAIAMLVVAAAAGGGYLLGSRTRSGVEGHSAAAAGTGATATKNASTRKVLYYRNPMGLADTSPTPKKDPMGMDYIPVYEGEDSPATDTSGANQIRISTDKVQKLGVRTEAAGLRPLGRTVRASGRVEPNERRIFVISPKFEGYVERLHVNATGESVARGQALFEVYSPELVSAQRAYAIAAQGVLAMKAVGGEALRGMQELAESGLTRLRNWDLPQDQIDPLVRTGEARRTVTLRSPVGGIVTEKKAFQGMRFMPGEALYQVTDLSAVWVIADVFEQDIALIRPGARAQLRLNAYPSEGFQGTITYVYPTLKAETRTVPVRIELANPRHLLKPAMFAQVEVQVGSRAPALAVPDSAVIDSGKRRIVLVQKAEGRFEPREVKTGARSDNYVEILEGVQAGEEVVVAANFLLDAESNLKAAVGGLGGHSGHGSPAKGSGSSPQPGPAAAGVVGHAAAGTVEGVDLKSGTVNIDHGPVASLKWPAMTMEFKAANPALLNGLRRGQAVSFEFVERQPGEYVVTSIVQSAGAEREGAAPNTPAVGKKAHSGH